MVFVQLVVSLVSYVIKAAITSKPTIASGLTVLHPALVLVGGAFILYRVPVYTLPTLLKRVGSVADHSIHNELTSWVVLLLTLPLPILMQHRLLRVYVDLTLLTIYCVVVNNTTTRKLN